VLPRWSRELATVGIRGAVLLLCCGCERDGLVRVSGRVTVGGVPVENGTIAMRPVKGDGPTAGALIVGGVYNLRVARGSNRVEIQAYKTVGMMHSMEGDPTSPLVPKLVPILPAKYNAETTLTLDVTQSRDGVDFAIQP
jgi:hypothetical protein